MHNNVTEITLNRLLKHLNTQRRRKQRDVFHRSAHARNRCSLYREDASSRPVEGHAVHGRQVSQDPLVHLHVLVHGRGHQLPEAV